MKTLLQIIFIMLSATVTATTYYVSSTGNNANTGTISSPFKTISYGESKLKGGDILYIRAGIYNEIVRIYGVPGGTEEKPTIISAYNYEEVIIDGKGLSVGTGNALVRSSNDYTQFIGLTVINSDQSGIMLDFTSNNSKVINCIVCNCWQTGIYGFGDYSVIDGCSVFNTAMSNSDGIYTPPEVWGGGISCRRTSADPAKHCIIKNCIVHDVWGEGIDMAFTDYGTIEDNIIYDIYAPLLYTRNNQHMLIQRNLIYMTKKMGDGSSVGIAHWNEDTHTFINNYNSIINNIVCGCGRNFYHYEATEGLLVANNTFINSKYFACIQISNRSTMVDCIFKNNIIVQENELLPIFVEIGTGLSFSNNLFNKAYDADAVATSDIIGDPKLAKTGETGAGKLNADYFKLLSTSPAINKGTVITSITNDYFNNPRSTSPDIGAHEFYASDPSIKVTSIIVTGDGGATMITTDKGTLQLTATISPSDATNKTVTWSVNNGTGQASISSSGFVTAIANGTVTARATANDGSGVYGELTITISNQTITVTGITVTGAGGSSTVTAGSTLQLTASVLPINATNKSVTWSVTNSTGQAVISSSGLVTANTPGTVTAKATANDGSGVFGILVITIVSQIISVTSITITGSGGASTITTDNGTLQLTATVLPSNATNKSVTWSIANGTGQASINSSGLVTAIANGTVTARATAVDGSGVSGTLVITISNQIVFVTGITVTGAGGVSIINTDKGTLQLSASVSPSNASNKSVTWSVINGTGQASINSSGLLTAVANGTVTARATANDGSGIYGTLLITISNQFIKVTSISVSGAGSLTSITTDNGTLQLSAGISPSNATNKTVTWSIINGTGQATINSSGLVSAVKNGTVTARAAANDGSGVYGTLIITISNQVILVSSITVTGAGGATVVSTGGSLQLSAEILPADASDKTVTWSVIKGTGQATINTSGLLTAVSNGTVTARATANDDSGVYGTLIITIETLIIPVTSITVTGTGGISTISVDDGTLQLNAAVLPSNATNKSVTWSVSNGTGEAIISSSGLVTAISNGNITARATAQDGTGVFGSLLITISNQIIKVDEINVSGEDGATTLVNGSTLQLTASVLPSDATNNTVTWSVLPGTGQASISSAGLLTAVSAGTVTARATANDGTGIFGTLTISIFDQIILVSGITVTGSGGAASVSEGSDLQLNALVLPSNAANKTVTWSIINGSGQAFIDQSGLVTALTNGLVTARATANDGSGTFGTLVITINKAGNQPPLIHITNPVNGKYFSSPANVLIESEVDDPEDDIVTIDYYLESDKIAEAVSFPYSFSYMIYEPGNYQIRASATDNSGNVAFSDPVEIVVTDETESPDFINLYPSPNNGQFTVELLNTLPGERNNISVINPVGQVCYSSLISNEEYSREFNLTRLKSGLYILVITGNRIVYTRKFLVE
jgi:uncharacterized protein YjdB